MNNQIRINKQGIKIGDVLGEGSFGKVYEGVYKASPCALKEVKTKKSSYKKFLPSEIDKVKEVKHPRILKFIKWFEIQDECYFVLEFMSGGSLAGLISSRKDSLSCFNENELMRQFYDVAAGLKVIHDKKIFHRNLKPENILIDERGRLKIADFGISEVRPTYFDEPRTETKWYIAPEILLGQSHGISSDIWSLGVVFFEMATFNYPFKNFIQVVKTISSFEPPKVTNPHYSKEVQGLINVMLHRDPRKRSHISEIGFVNILCSDSWDLHFFKVINGQ